ncbi:hypothetical protein ACHAPX_000226 [Trichoderma viride]
MSPPPEVPSTPGVEQPSSSADASEVTCIQDPSAGLMPDATRKASTTATHAAPDADADADPGAGAGARHKGEDAGTRSVTATAATSSLDAEADHAADAESSIRTDATSVKIPAAIATTATDTTTATATATATAASATSSDANELLSTQHSSIAPLPAPTTAMASDEGSGRPTNADAELNKAPADEALEAHEQTIPTAPKEPAAAVETPDDAIDSSILTINPADANPSSLMRPNYPTSLLLAPERPSYIDPTPPTPMASRPPSRALSVTTRTDDETSPTRSNPESDDKPFIGQDDQEDSQSEIQSIMEQFSEDGGGPDAEEVMSPRLEIASPMLGTSLQHPPRKSSLEPLAPGLTGQLQGLNALHISTPGDDDDRPPVPPKDGSMGTPPRTRDARLPPISVASPASPTMSMHRPPPPAPEPEPTLPFDFHRFLEQLRNKKADPVARYLKSFLFEFGKRQWMVHEQVKIISDFLAFIANKMVVSEVWRDVSDAEFDNAREGMEKLVMNRLYSQTFSPAIPPPKPIPGAKPRRRGGDPPLGPGRRGQHQEDIERDDVLTQRINIYGWVKEAHLDIPPIEESGRRFLKLAQQELLKIKSYRAPRDKIICVLNCCKVIFGLLKHSKSDSSADSFMPMLIYVVLQSNPEHLVSNVQYILRFRNQEKLGGEAGYYLSSLMGAIQFIENMDRTSLTITDEDFEKNVEAAVSAIAEKHQALSPKRPQDQQQQQIFNEKSRPPESSYDGAGPSAPRRSTDQNDTDNLTAPITGLLRTIQNPLTTIGRMFSDDGASSSAPRSPPPPIGRPLGFPENVPLHNEDRRRSDSRYPLPAEEAAARQASAEVAEAQRLHRAEHTNIVETLAGMFPDLDKDIISDVVYQKEGRVGLAVDACLALSS